MTKQHNTYESISHKISANKFENSNQFYGDYGDTEKRMIEPVASTSYTQ